MRIRQVVNRYSFVMLGIPALLIAAWVALRLLGPAAGVAVVALGAMAMIVAQRALRPSRTGTLTAALGRGRPLVLFLYSDY